MTNIELENTILLKGSANPKLADEIGQILGIEPLNCTQRFADNEIKVAIPESVRDKRVFIIQPTTPPLVNDHYIELFELVDAAKRADSAKITAVIPYYGYARQDARKGKRAPITASLMADCLKTSGVDQVITIDIHTDVPTGIIKPWESLTAKKPLLNKVKESGLGNCVIVSPDDGGMERAVAASIYLGYGENIAMVGKLHNQDELNKVEALFLVGDVKGRCALMIDDMIDTAGTATGAAKLLVENGANEIWMASTHGVLSNPALHRLTDSPIEKLFITNSIAQRDEVLAHPKIQIVSIAPLLAEAIENIVTHKSLEDQR